jgi:ATP-binding cassette, subfamily B, bacterial
MSAEFVTQTDYKTDHRTPGRFIWSHITRQPWLLLMMCVGAFSNAALAGALPYLTGVAFTAIRDTPNAVGMQAVLWSVIGIIISQLVRSVLQLMRNASAETYAQRIERDVREELYASVLGKSMTFHDRTPVGEIMARVTNDVREMNFFMNPGVNLVVGSGMFLIIPLVASPLIYPDLLWTPLAFVVLHAVVQVYFVRELHPIAQEVRASFGRMNARLAEALDGLQVIKGAAQEDQEARLFEGRVDEVKRRFIQQGGVEARYISNLMLPLALVIGLIHSIILYDRGLITVGDIIAYNGMIGLFGFPVFTSLNSLARLALGYASADRILNVINTQTDLDRNEGGHHPRRGRLHGCDLQLQPDRQTAGAARYHLRRARRKDGGHRRADRRGQDHHHQAD